MVCRAREDAKGVARSGFARAPRARCEHIWRATGCEFAPGVCHGAHFRSVDHHVRPGAWSDGGDLLALRSISRARMRFFVLAVAWVRGGSGCLNTELASI